MRMPPLSLAVGLLIVRTLFLLSRLNSNAKARTLMPKIQPHHDALENARTALIKCENALLFARGPVIEVNEAVALTLTALQLDVLKVVNKNYNDPLYRALFPKGLAEVRKVSGQALCDELVRLQQRITELGKSHPLAAHLPAIATHIKDYAAPLKTLKAAQDARQAANVVVDKARADWRVAYDAIAGALREMFPGRKTYQDSFFMQEDARSTKKPAADAAPAPAEDADPSK